MSELVPRDELLALLAIYCAGELTEAEGNRLAEILRDDADSRRVYLEYMEIHSSLAWEASSAADLDVALDDDSKDEDQPPKPPLDSKSPSALPIPPIRELPSWLQFIIGTRWGIALTIASAFLMLLLSVLAVAPSTWFNHAEDSLADDDIPSNSEIVAYFSGSKECVWVDRKSALSPGSSLVPGQRIELVSGTAEIAFMDGAVVTLRGPADYIVDSAEKCSLYRGELTALVPPLAHGFSVRTPQALVVDLGTEFGVSVKPVDESKVRDDAPLATTEEMHVFQGKVEFSLHNGSQAPRLLASNEAVRINTKGEIEQLAVARDQFPQPVDDKLVSNSDANRVPNERPPVTRALSLWLAADGKLQRDAANRVSVWGDMPIDDENRKAQDATQQIGQHQPIWVAAAINGRPAIRFDGDDYLEVATPRDLGMLSNSYEVFFVARTGSPTIQFLMAGILESYELHINGDSGARFIPATYVDKQDASDLGTSSQFSDGRPHIFAARVHTDVGFHGAVSVDGVESEIPSRPDGRSADNVGLRIGLRGDGSYGLQGDILEVLIYRDGLTNEERSQIQKHLATRYQIPLE